MTKSTQNKIITHDFLLTIEDNYHEWLDSHRIKLLDPDSCGEFYISVKLGKLSSLDVKVTKTFDKAAMAIIELQTNGMFCHIKDVPDWKESCNFNIDFPYYYLQYSNAELNDNFKYYLSIKCKIIWFGFKDELVASNLYRDMKQFLINIECSDVVVQIKNRQFPSHKKILVSQSPVLKSMLMTTTKKFRKKYIKLPKIDTETAEELFLFLYTGKVDKANDDFELAVKLFEVAKDYQISGLINLCGLLLSDKITRENVMNLLKLVEDQKEDDVFILQQRAIAFIWNNRREILTLDNFKESCKFIPQSLFKIIEKVID